MDDINKKQWSPRLLGEFLVKNGAICNQYIPKKTKMKADKKHK